ncbi:LLM class flavin-dependent oxidoreductase [Actinomadura decatromicini]|uniref:LLM class flavin-dependent oxidoreductase n=1 Tax=Actinomadura decatromicini TaxID=2604572 RepID=A0A5D3FY40_9ACTN|nr:LLM class flavin-dependent oxidoreductase [Actinomadura decatromicini]TYK53093.1 LLM class flavin-dependent oxidoreductase [Actinomadura decatromicini]
MTSTSPAGKPPRFLLTLPTTGPDPAPAPLPEFVTDLRRGRYGAFDTIAEAGRAAEVTGFDGVVAPFAPDAEESLVAVAGLLRDNRWIHGVAGLHPGVGTPVYAAKLSASLQRFTGDRFGWWPVVDLPPATARAHGDFLEGPDRYARADEFLTIAKGVWAHEDFIYEGRFFQVLAGGFQGPLAARRFPAVHLSGVSADALDLSAKHADVHVFDVTGDLDALIADLGERAAARGRTVACGLRLSVAAREDEDEARAVRGVPEHAVTGSFEQVAAELRGYAERGVSTFVLDPAPHVEEIYRLGEQLLPLFVREHAHVD